MTSFWLDCIDKQSAIIYSNGILLFGVYEKPDTKLYGFAVFGRMMKKDAKSRMTFCCGF